ncbi:MAG: TraB/GumN family protein [Sphingobium sp.]|nr:MAG: TraB/GumN family protein [Sphingobium sp.]
MSSFSNGRRLGILSAFSIIALLFAPVAASARTAARAAHPALWKVQDADTTIYLFGSVHVLKPGTVWFEGPVKAAFDASGTLVMEMIDPSQDEMAQQVAALGLARDGTALSDRLAPDARARYQAAMQDAGLPWQSFEQFQPWMAAISLAVAPLAKLGYSQDAGVEKVLTDAAKAQGKAMEGLETPAQQLGYFAGLTQEQQVTFLNQTVADMPKAENEFGTLVSAWAKGQSDRLARQMNESLEETPEIAEVLLFGRNARWATWIADRMQRPGTLFVAVGAGHLSGPRSVIDQLKGLGLSAVRIGKGKH